MTRTAVALLVTGAGVLAGGPAGASDPPVYLKPAGDPHARAGHPQEISPLAVPGRGHGYRVGYVGGGRLVLFPRHKDGRDIYYDGTFGWDYALFGHRPGRLFLDYWHDRPRQPRSGTYNPDGPHVPDVVALHPFQRLAQAVAPKHFGKKEEEHEGEHGGGEHKGEAGGHKRDH